MTCLRVGFSSETYRKLDIRIRAPSDDRQVAVVMKSLLHF